MKGIKGTPKGTKLTHVVGYNRLVHKDGYETGKTYCSSCVNKEQVIAAVSKDKKFLYELNNKLAADSIFFKDLMQDIYIALLEKKEEDIMRMNKLGQIIFYVKSLVWIQVRSESSRFYTNYKRFSSKTNTLDNPNWNISEDNNKILMDKSQSFFGDSDMSEPYYVAGQKAVEQINNGKILTSYEKDIFTKRYIQGLQPIEFCDEYGMSPVKMTRELLRCIEKIQLYIIRTTGLKTRQRQKHYTKINQKRPDQTLNYED